MTITWNSSPTNKIMSFNHHYAVLNPYETMRFIFVRTKSEEKFN